MNTTSWAKKWFVRLHLYCKRIWKVMKRNKTRVMQPVWLWCCAGCIIQSYAGASQSHVTILILVLLVSYCSGFRPLFTNLSPAVLQHTACCFIRSHNYYFLTYQSIVSDVILQNWEHLEVAFDLYRTLRFHPH